MKWEYYSKRRNVTLDRFVAGRNLRTYQSIVECFARQGIDPVTEEQYNEAFVIAFPPPPQKKVVPQKPRAKTPQAKKAPAKKPVQRTRRTRASTTKKQG